MNNTVDYQNAIKTMQDKTAAAQKRLIVFCAISLLLAVILLLAVPFISTERTSISFGEIDEYSSYVRKAYSLDSVSTMHTILWVVTVIAAIAGIASYVIREKNANWCIWHVVASIAMAMFTMILMALHFSAELGMADGLSGMAYWWILLFAVELIWVGHAIILVFYQKGIDKIREAMEKDGQQD